MRREDVVDIFRRLPDSEHPRVHVILRAGPNVSIDTVIRLEPHYAVFRGREAGNQDEGRVFFVPFDEMVCMKMERVVKSHELEVWYNDTTGLARKDDKAEVKKAVVDEEPVMQDPSEIARQNLLDRIRAARSVVKK